MVIRHAVTEDLKSILIIYNQGIEDRIATLETEPKDMKYMSEWFAAKSGRYVVLTAVNESSILGWASISPYNSRCAYEGVGEVSVYIERSQRGKGIGKKLLNRLEEHAQNSGFHKLVLFTFPFNQLGQRLYRRVGFREVGVFKNQGKLDGKFVDVMAMEKVL